VPICLQSRVPVASRYCSAHHVSSAARSVFDCFAAVIKTLNRGIAVVFDPVDVHGVSAAGGAVCQQRSELLTASPNSAE
jgi:hypothetical protein